MQIQSVAVGWQVYELTGDPLSLGLVGLAQFGPMFLLTLPAGDIADRVHRGKLLAATFAAQAATAGLLALFTFSPVSDVWIVYLVLILFGAARAFSGPAGQSFLPLLVTPAQLPTAIAWSTSSFQIAVVAGPAIGGAALIFGPLIAYLLCLFFFLGAAIAMVFLPVTMPERVRSEEAALTRMLAGARFVWAKPIVLGAISLDLFAVLLGGVTALLPVFAKDILDVGPDGLGLLRSAPAVGAAIVSITLGFLPLQRRAGMWVYLSVALFGVATIIFGLSEIFWLSLAMLFLLGAADMVSVYVRLSLVQLATPDAMRGRVSAVNMLFIGASNELGEFESGVTAALFGVVPSVLIGGVGTILIVALWTRLFPALGKVDRLADVRPD